MGLARRQVAFAWAGLGVLAAVALLAPGLRTPVLLVSLALAAAVLVSAGRASRRLIHQAVEHERQALHDPVADLPNRLLLHDRIHQAIAHAERHGGDVAVLLLDLDRFKEVNDTLGHHNGDLLLHLVGARLSRELRTGDTVARLGGGGGPARGDRRRGVRGALPAQGRPGHGPSPASRRSCAGSTPSAGCSTPTRGEILLALRRLDLERGEAVARGQSRHRRGTVASAAGGPAASGVATR